MTKRKNRKYVITSDQLFNAEKPKWNGFGCGHGVHGDTKYNRRKNKKAVRNMIDKEWF